jgi:hypothetical protein
MEEKTMPEETKTISITLPAELADKFQEALQADHVTLEQLLIGWLVWGRREPPGIAEPGAHVPSLAELGAHALKPKSGK